MKSDIAFPNWRLQNNPAKSEKRISSKSFPLKLLPKKNNNNLNSLSPLATFLTNPLHVSKFYGLNLASFPVIPAKFQVYFRKTILFAQNDRCTLFGK